jgi:hypothetical protein
MKLPLNNIVTSQYLSDNPSAIFVFGDNLHRIGRGGAAALRYHPQAIGFITKKEPKHTPASYFFPEEYKPIFQKEVTNLVKTISNNPDKVFLISPVGSGLANKYGIFEQVIDGPLQQALSQFTNVKFLWESSTNI